MANEKQAVNPIRVIPTAKPETKTVRMTHSGVELKVSAEVAAMLVQSGDAEARES